MALHLQGYELARAPRLLRSERVNVIGTLSNVTGVCSSTLAPFTRTSQSYDGVYPTQGSTQGRTAATLHPALVTCDVPDADAYNASYNKRPWRLCAKSKGNYKG